MKKSVKSPSKDFEFSPFGSNPDEAKYLRQEALGSAFMRIPGVKVETARDLLDLGFLQPYQIAGRAPETLFADLCKIRPKTPLERLDALRHVVSVAESAVSG